MPAAAQDLSRITYLRRCLSLCFYPLLTVLAGNGVLMGLPQARETLTAFDEVNGRYALFLLSVLYWSATAWYCSRLMLGKRFPVDDLPHCVSPTFAAGVTRWLPRLLGAGSTLPIAYFFWRADQEPKVWLPVVVTTVGFFVFVVGRRRWFSLDDHKGPGRAVPRFEELQRASWLFIGLVVLVSAAVWMAVWFSRVQAARFIGAPALLLVALGSWTVFGSLILTYLPRSYRWPSLALTPIVVAFIVSLLRENHVVAHEGRDAAADARPALVDDFTKWNEARGAAKNEPVYLIAAAGGASRAAYWAGIVLRDLEQAARANHVRFARNVYALSGVSGGSLGVAAFVGSLAAESASGQPLHATMQPDPLAFLGEDFLAPLVGGLLYTDAVATFLPWPCRSCDRSHAIEQAWMDDWRSLSKGSGVPEWFAQGLLAGMPDVSLPRLFLNSTAVGDGRRVIQSAVRFAPTEAYDLLTASAPQLNTKGLTLAGAVHNSARFPYASPVGQVRNAKGETWDYLADGGYFENSGAATLQAIIAEIKKHPAYQGSAAPQFIVLLIENEPVKEVRWICPRDQTPLHQPADVDLPLWPEITAPPSALYQTRTARAQAAEHDIITELKGCGSPKSVFEIRYPKLKGIPKEPPMSWFLNKQTRKEMEQMMHSAEDDGSIRRLKGDWNALLTRMGIPSKGR